ncbi:MFS transporter [Scytonema hofmannii FACHB-248]|uniref:MFS transporter n=1 Tax=Scytonema hofmannii FACHB-248 TaxID=1842502 RepID=A0ABR8GWB9_9CYAN|nr:MULTISPECIES: MFS transporter [Nostocales]MBD2607811.1 MFS transporter [Scytonema hofmannii FACHB-248]
MDSVEFNIGSPLVPKNTQVAAPETAISPTAKPGTPVTKDAIRTSLRASTIDSAFAAFYTITTSGILLSNFLVDLHASPVAIGMLASIPMLLNLIQPVGAYLSERITSRFHYSLWTNIPGRLAWIILLLGIIAFSWGLVNSHQLVVLTLGILLVSHLSAGLGSASWLSWMAQLVPRKLRGRFFGLRNSVASLTNLICVPLAGLVISKWSGGAIQGYGVVVFIGILSGILSLGCQYFQLDVNPQQQNTLPDGISEKKAILIEAIDKDLPNTENTEIKSDSNSGKSIFKDFNFLMFMLYLGLWTFAVNLSAPFFNYYLLDTLDIDVTWVTTYGSLRAGATLVMLIFWGKLADKIGNRPILFLVGIVLAVSPLLWLLIGNSQLDIWLWLPLLHILLGVTWAGIDLCNNNIQLGIAPARHQAIYFANAAAVAGVSGALGTTIGGFVTQFSIYGGLLGLFAISVIFRLVALTPLVFVREAKH